MLQQMAAPIRINTGMSTLEDPASLQNEYELQQFIDVMRAKRVTSYLEIGVRYGGTFEAVCNELPLLERAVALDFPGGPFGDDKSLEYLLSALCRIRGIVPDVHLILGPSQAWEVINRAKALGPYDAILIDGDHAYDAVRRDYVVYEQMTTKLTAMHDIAAPKGTTDKRGTLIETGEYWSRMRTIKGAQEIIAPGSIMGIGLVHKTVA